MIKKIILTVSVLVMIFALSACGTTGQSLTELVLPGEGTETSGASGVEEKVDLEAIKASDYDDTLDGLREYMKDSYIVTGDAVEMSYDVIGATGGYKYQFTYRTSTVQVELYSFDPDNLSDTARENLNSIKENGTFTVLETEVSAYISDNGKYIMIYSDASSDEENKQQQERAVELFKSFYS